MMFLIEVLFEVVKYFLRGGIFQKLVLMLFLVSSLWKIVYLVLC